MKRADFCTMLGLAISLLAGTAAFSHAGATDDQTSPLLRGGSIWAPSTGCQVEIPNGWVAQEKPIPSAVMMSSADNDRDRIRVQTTSELVIELMLASEKNFDSPLAQSLLRRKANSAASPAPIMAPSNAKVLSEGSGTFRQHPAAWSAVAFDTAQLGRRVNLVYAIGNVAENAPVLFYVSFFLVPEAQFGALQPTFEAIAASCSVRGSK